MADYTWGKPVEATPKSGTSVQKALGSQTRQVTHHTTTAIGGRPENVTDVNYDLIQVEGGEPGVLYSASQFDLNCE